MSCCTAWLLYVFPRCENGVSCGCIVKISNLSSAQPLQLMPRYVRCLSESISVFFFFVQFVTDRINRSTVAPPVEKWDDERVLATFNFAWTQIGPVGCQICWLLVSMAIQIFCIEAWECNCGCWTTSNVFTHARRIPSHLIYIYRAPALYYE